MSAINTESVKQRRSAYHGRAWGRGRARPLRHSDRDSRPLLSNTAKKILLLHSLIHATVHKVTNLTDVPHSDYGVRPGQVLLSSPMVSHVHEEHFANPVARDPHRGDDATEKRADDDDDDVADHGHGTVAEGT